MQQYLDTLSDVLYNGDLVQQRNSKTLELFGLTVEYKDIKNNFPVVTTKKMPIKTIIAEMLCFLRGYDEVGQFKSMGVNVWNANAESSYWKANPNHKEGWLGRIYGVQWRDWRGKKNFFGDIPTDQITDLISRLKSNPHDRRHIVTAWNPAELDLMC